MRTILTILLLIFIQSTYGQNNVVELKSFMGGKERTKSIKEKIKKANFNTLDVIDVYVELDREIDFDYRHHRIRIMPAKGWDLKLNFLSNKGVIKHGWISEYKSDNEKHMNLELFKAVPEILNEYISKHHKFYQVNLNEADFEEQVLAEYVVGFGCGFSGEQISKESKATLRYSDNKNIKKLNDYLTSFSPELQTLGAIGLFKIGKLNDSQNKIISHLKSRNSEINSCAGCIYGFGETFNDRIKHYEGKASR